MRLELRYQRLQSSLGEIRLQARRGDFLCSRFAVVIKSVKQANKPDQRQHVDYKIGLQQIPRGLPHGPGRTWSQWVQQGTTCQEHECQEKRRHDLNRHARPELVTRRTKAA